jgi:hypothetical protein
MKKTLLIGMASAAALVPAALGLSANPSLSAKVPVPSIQVPLTTVAATHDAHDDKGGQRSRTVSDDVKSSGKHGGGKHGSGKHGSGGHGSDD